MAAKTGWTEEEIRKEDGIGQVVAMSLGAGASALLVLVVAVMVVRKSSRSRSLSQLSETGSESRSDQSTVVGARSTSSASEATLAFDLEEVAILVEAALAAGAEAGGVGLEKYVAAYRHLNRLFPQLGRVFAFIQQDAEAKLGRLSRLVEQKPDAEVRTSLLEGVKSRPAKDTPTYAFLSLQRALRFIVRLLKDVWEAEDSALVGPIVRKAYDDTLGRHHGLPVRAVAYAAFRSLPDRRKIAPLFFNPPHRPRKEDAAPVVARFLAAVEALQARVRPILLANPVLTPFAA